MFYFFSNRQSVYHLLFYYLIVGYYTGAFWEGSDTLLVSQCVSELVKLSSSFLEGQIKFNQNGHTAFTLTV